jgi:sugar (pentulose or hexulose) kinase
MPGRKFSRNGKINKENWIMNEYLIGLDVGTSTIKGVLISSSGEIVCQEKQSTELLYPKPHYIEFSIEEHYRKVCLLIGKLVSGIPSKGHVAAVAISGASGSTVLLGKYGEPLLTSICWMDERASTESVEVLEKMDTSGIHRISGWPFLKSFPFANLAWIREKMPEVYRRKARFCTDIDYINHGLSDLWAIDCSSATPTCMLEQRAMKWNKSSLAIIELHEESLSKLMPSCSIIGEICRNAQEETRLFPNTKLVAGAFDHPSAAIGTGVFDPDSLLISTGTSWVGFHPVIDREAAIDEGMLLDPFLFSKGGCWGSIFSIPKIGAEIDFCVNSIFDGENLSMQDKYALFNRKSGESPVGAGGLFADLRSRESYQGLMGDANFCRAVMESAAYLLRKNIERFTAGEPRLNRIVMSGGPTQSPVWTQIVADVTGIPLILGGGQCAGALGAAVMAGVGAGVFKNEKEGFQTLKVESKTIEPDSQRKKIYDEFYSFSFK